jgi:Heparinase II/III-like protein/Heparinase II/III N-terminus
VSAAATLAPVRPRPVYCVTEHLRRDRRVADEACEGRFTELGTTLGLGVPPDWTGAAFPVDEEWRIAWAKFYFGLDLAAAFRETGDERYQRTWELLVESWIEQVQVGSESTDTVARRLLNWVYAWNGFASSQAFAGLGDGVAARMLESMAAQVTWLRDNLTPRRNHRTLELYAQFVVALALPGLDTSGELLDFALAELHRNLSSDFRPDGVHVESSTHYHLIVLRSFVGVRENARRFALELAPDFDERLSRALDFGLHCHRPDGAIPALSDSDTDSYAELLALAADQLARPDLLYAATRGARGTPPRARNVGFPDGGYYVQRSGWGEGADRFEDERFLILDCGPLGEGGHGHYDLLSVELSAGGRPLIVDPGRYTYHEGHPDRGGGPNLRRWFKGTAAHNTVLVDRLDQTEYHRRKPKGPIAEGRFLGRMQAPGLDVLWGEALTPRYDARHRRRVLFVAGQYWVFEDRLTAQRPHRYAQRWHLAPFAQGRVEVSPSDHGALVRAPGLALVFAPGVRVELEDGWYAPKYGVKQRAPVVSAVAEGAADATLLTVVAPTPPGAAAPRLRTGRWDGARVAVEVERSRARDTVAWAVDGSEATLERSEVGE